ncbi:fibrinogen-binding protein, partial [Streptococcus agalactiae]|nr:fibrinogen-binding protein [Streptococcus agalactiae]
MLEKVNKFRQQDYFKNDYVKVLDYKQQLVEGLTSCERIIKTLETDKPTPEHIIKEKVLHLAKITEDVNDFMNGLKT